MEQRREMIPAVQMDSPHLIPDVHGGGDADPKVDVFSGEDSNFAFGDPVSGDDSEFAFVPRDPAYGHEIAADDIFSNGQIRTSFPLFGRELSPAGSAAADPEPEAMIRMEKLAIEDKDSFAVSTSSSECGDELERLPDGTYCVWSPGLRRRSASANEERRRPVPDLGEGRSRSDGNQKFIFLARPPPAEKQSVRNSIPAPNPKGKVNGKKAKGGKVTEMDMVTAYKLYYSKKGGEAAKSGRRSFLPYRPEVFGFFGNAAARGHNPF